MAIHRIDKPSNTTVLEDFIDRHLDKDWCFAKLSSNPEITLKYIEKHIEQKWDFYEMSQSPNITRSFVEKYYYVDWNFDWLNVNGVLGESDTLVDFDTWNGDYPCMCRNATEHYDRCGLNFTYILNRNFGLWGLSSNKNVTLEFIEQNVNGNWHWGLHGLSSNPNLTTEFVEKYKCKGWHWGSMGLSQNLKMDQQFIDKHDRKLHWSVTGVSNNKYLTTDLMELYQNKLDFQQLSSNPNLTTHFIEKYIYKCWDWYFLSYSTFNSIYQKDADNLVRNRAARIIQQACENWLYSPMCKDKTIGIVPRLGFKACLQCIMKIK
jgi:hypothetical protein